MAGKISKDKRKGKGGQRRTKEERGEEGGGASIAGSSRITPTPYAACLN